MDQSISKRPSCIRCHTELQQQGKQWTHCKHEYCAECVSALVHEHLSVFNTIPTCIRPQCDQPLNMEHISASIISIRTKYHIDPTFHLSNTNHLITGYIRNINAAIPDDITLLISDFHHLDITKTIPKTCVRIPLSSSNATPFIPHMTLDQARRLRVGDIIDHRHERDGLYRHAVIVAKEGSLLKVDYESPHSLHPYEDSWKERWTSCKQVLACGLCAKYDSITRRPCHRLMFQFEYLPIGCKVRINPTQTLWRRGQIEKCDKYSAQVQVRYKNEYQRECIYWTHLDNSAEIRLDETQLHGFKYDDRENCLTVLDVHKLCKKQIQCKRCNEYYPMNLIMHWFNCQHPICVHCLLPFVEREVMAIKRIPLCPETECNEEMHQHNAYFIYDVWEHSCCDIENRQMIKGVLETLFYRKNKFECAFCNCLHPDHALCVDKSVDCEHKYSAECRAEWIESNGDTDCIQCVDKCEICEQYSVNRDLRTWSECGHKYHIDCAQEYINEWIPLQENKSIFEFFTTTECLIPLCIQKHCDQFLDMQHALYFGLSCHQSSVLRDLRQGSILIEKKEDFIHLNFTDYDNKSAKERKNKLESDFGKLEGFDIS
eukprot:755608_1